MAETTKIEWCDATFNPWIGCSKCSPGCDNCYAERMFRRGLFGKFEWGNGQRARTSEENWKHPIRWNRKCERNRTRMSVFAGSLCDIGDTDSDYVWFFDFMCLIVKTPYLDWLLLTKRPESLKNRINYFYKEYWGTRNNIIPNLWVGVTVCNQEEAKKVWTLLDIPAIGRFVSVEPMLGPVDLNKLDLLCATWIRGGATIGRYLDWVICGGETGPNARPMHPDWVRNLRNQCQGEYAQTPFFFKGWGEWSPSAPLKNGVYDLDSASIVSVDGTVFDPSSLTYPDGKRRMEAYNIRPFNGTSMYRVGKKVAGCELEFGSAFQKEYKEFPKQLQ